MKIVKLVKILLTNVSLAKILVLSPEFHVNQKIHVQEITESLDPCVLVLKVISMTGKTKIANVILNLLFN